MQKNISAKQIELWKAESRESLTRLLGRVVNLEFLGFADAKIGLISAKYVFGELNRYDAEPFSKLWWEASDTEIKAWLLSCLKTFGNNPHFFITLGSDVWAEINGDTEGSWLPHLWSQPEVEDLAILSWDGQRALGIVTDEFYLIAIAESVRSIVDKRTARAK